MATILIVDDDPDTRDLLGRYLRGVAGHRTLQAADGLEALDLLGTERIDLIVLDLLMPRMGGAEFLATIRSCPAGLNVPVLVCSALGREGLAAGGDTLPGIAGILVKGDGFFIDLIEAVTRLAGASSAAMPSPGLGWRSMADVPPSAYGVPTPCESNA
ncbi:MAG TPA: response regulator [Humisphaera sp.]